MEPQPQAEQAEKAVEKLVSFLRRANADPEKIDKALAEPGPGGVVKALALLLAETHKVNGAIGGPRACHFHDSQGNPACSNLFEDECRSIPGSTFHPTHGCPN